MKPRTKFYAVVDEQGIISPTGQPLCFETKKLAETMAEFIRKYNGYAKVRKCEIHLIK